MPEFIPGTRGGHDTTTSHFATQLTGSVAGAPVTVNQPLVLAADGRLYPVGVETGVFVGVAPRSLAVSGTAMTAHGVGQRFHASDDASLVIGARYFLGTRDGKISTAATANDSEGAFVAVSATDLMVTRIGQATTGWTPS